MRYRVGKEKVKAAERLLAIGSEADPDTDPLRLQIREANKRGDAKALAELAGKIDVATQPVFTTFVIARNLHHSGAVEQAVAMLLKAHRRHPNDFWINHQLGLWFLELRPPQKEQALRFLSGAVALRPKSAAVQSNLGMALEENGLVDEAITAYQEAIRLKPDEPGIHYNLGGALAAKGRQPDAVKAYGTSIQLDPEFLPARLGLGKILGKQGKLAEADAEFAEAIRRHAKDALAHNAWGAFLCDTKRDYVAAVAAFRVAIGLQKDHPDAHGNLGLALYHQNKLTEAETAFREAIRLDPYHANARYNFGTLLHAQRKLVEAEQEFREAIGLRPHFAGAHVNLGVVLLKQSKWVEAAAASRAAIRLRLKVAEVHANLGFALLNLRKPAEAEVEYKAAIGIKSDYPQARGNLGVALMHQRKWKEAIANFEEGFRLNQCNPPALWNLAGLLANCPEPKLRNPKRAVEVAKKAVEVARESPNSWQVLGWAQYRAGDFKAAIEALNKAMVLRKGGDLRDWFFLAMAHWQLGNKDEARQWYDKAVAWTEKHAAQDEELRRFQAEAQELLERVKKKN